MYSIIEAESQFQNTCNTKGCAYGIGPAQIVQSTFDEQCEGNINNEQDNLECAAKMLKNGDYWRWEQSWNKWLPKIATSTRNNILKLCSCIHGIRSREIFIKGNAKDIPTGDPPTLGALAKFYYPSTRSYHVALITNMNSESFTVYETNFSKCKEGRRKVFYQDPALIGFYSSDG